MRRQWVLGVDGLELATRTGIGQNMPTPPRSSRERKDFAIKRQRNFCDAAKSYNLPINFKIFYFIYVEGEGVGNMLFWSGDLFFDRTSN